MELEGAEWVIFRRDQVPGLRVFLEHRFKHDGGPVEAHTDVIYGQVIERAVLSSFPKPSRQLQMWILPREVTVLSVLPKALTM